MKRTLSVWHPESPGIRLNVRRGFWGRLFKPRDFATLGEVIAAHRAQIAQAKGGDWDAAAKGGV